MKTFKKAIALTVAVCFLATNVVYGDINSFKLSPPSKFSRMANMEFKEAAQIRIGILEALKGVDGLTLANIQALGEKQFSEKTVFDSMIVAVIGFNKVEEGQVRSGNIVTENNCYIFKALIKGRNGQVDKSYYCLLSKDKIEGQYPISVVPETVISEALQKGTVKFAHSSVDSKDKEIIDRYTAHEITTANDEAIDPWIARHMEVGNYAVDENTANSPLYGNAGKRYNNGLKAQLIKGRMDSLQATGMGEDGINAIWNVMSSRPVVFIPYKNRGELPTININGQPICVDGHSSEFATYIFLEQRLYDEIVSGKSGDSYSEEFWRIVSRKLLHEIGARCGLPVRIEGVEAVNLLDDWSNTQSLGGFTHYLYTQLTPKNLLELELRNDYAAGEVPDNTKKSIFRRYMWPILAALGLTTVGGVTYYATKEKPVEVKKEAAESRKPEVGKIDKTAGKPVEEGANTEFYGANFSIDGVLTECIIRRDSKIYRVSRHNVDGYTFDRNTGVIEIAYLKEPVRTETVNPGDGYYREAVNKMGQIMEKIAICQIGLNGIAQEDNIRRVRHAFLLECSGYLGEESKSQPATALPSQKPEVPTTTTPTTISAAQPYQFAHKYTVEGVTQNPREAEAFMQEYFKWESEFYKNIRVNGIAMDGFNLKEDTLEPAQIKDWTAASKECLDLAVQLKILAGNKYGIRLTGNNSAESARQTAIKVLKEKIGVYEEYSRSFPAFGGFLSWITVKDGKIQPTSDWSDRLPALDNGEWVWSLYTTYHTLKNIGENDLAVRYKTYFEMLVKNAPAIFYDTNLRKIRAEVKIRDPKAGSVEVNNYSNNTSGYYLDDCYEGMMMISFLTLFTDLPKSEKDHIWDDIKMEKVTTTYGTTYKGWPPQSPLDGSPHIKWAFMFLPFTDNPIAMKVYLLQEKIRTNMHKYGIPVSTNTPGGIGYTAYEPNVFGLYGPFSMIFGQTLQGEVTQNNYGLAWFLNVLQADKMQGPLGSGESLSVEPGTNHLQAISTVLTCDGKMTLWLAMMGGINNETREALKTDGLYDRLMAPINRLYSDAFGNLDSVQDNAQFRMPQKAIEGKHAPELQVETAELMDLSTFWQYPALDKWGDKAAARIDGNKIMIEYRPGSEGGWGWVSGSLRGPLTPKNGSAIYLKGKGSFTLKLECQNKEAAYIDVTLEGENKWTKIPLDIAVGKTYFVLVIDKVTENIVIGDRYYSPNGNLPKAESETTPSAAEEKRREKIRRKDAEKIEKAVEKMPAGEAAERVRGEERAIKEAEKRNEIKPAAFNDLMSMYYLSPDRHWGTALVSRSGKSLVVKHNEAQDGSGWSWTGESLKKAYTLGKNEGFKITGKGTFTLKLEGSETLLRKVDMGAGGSVMIDDLPAELRIERIVVDQVMPGTTVEIEAMEIINTKAQSSNMYQKGPTIVGQRDLINEVSDAAIERLWKGWAIETGNQVANTEINGTSMAVLAMLGVFAFPKPEDGSIRALAARIKDSDIEVFMPKSQFPNDTLRRFKDGLGRVFGDRLRVYDTLVDLATMIKTPGKSIVMNVALSEQEVTSARDSFNNLKDVRFMNFERVNVEEFISQGVYDNYIMDTLSKLLVGRAITREEANDDRSDGYQLMAHLLSGHMPKEEIDGYIRQLANNEMDPIVKMLNLIKQILRAMPIVAYKDEQLKSAVQVLWAA